MTTRTLKNVGASPIVLSDLNGLTIAPNESVDGLQLGEFALRNSIDVVNGLVNDGLELFDGYTTTTGLRAVDIIRGTTNQATPDGKLIVTASDRPANTYRYFTTKGDDMTNHILGEGEDLNFWIAPGQSMTKDIQFLEDTYIKDGQVHYWNVEDLSFLDMVVVCPAGVPFPAPDHNGNYDLVGATWTPNGTNTGAYFILGTETVIFRFVNKYPLTKFDGFGYIESPEPQLFPTPYKFRITVFNNNTTDNLRASVVINMYRKHTIGTM